MANDKKELKRSKKIKLQKELRQIGCMLWAYLGIETVVMFVAAIVTNAVNEEYKGAVFPVFSLICVGVFMAYFWIKTRDERKQNTQKEEKTGITKDNIVVGVILSLFFNYIVTIINYVIEMVKPGMLTPVAVDNNNGLLVLVLGIINTCIVAPVYEEILYRGYICRKLNKYNRMAAIVLSSFLYAIAHMNLSQLVFTFAFGIVLAVIYTKTKSLGTVIVIHMINNVFGVVWTLCNNIVIYCVLGMFVTAMAVYYLYSKRSKIKELMAIGNKQLFVDVVETKPLLFWVALNVAVLLYYVTA